VVSLCLGYGDRFDWRVIRAAGMGRAEEKRYENRKWC
jgi:hypothetical protein